MPKIVWRSLIFHESVFKFKGLLLEEYFQHACLSIKVIQLMHTKTKNKIFFQKKSMTASKHFMVLKTFKQNFDKILSQEQQQ